MKIYTPLVCAFAVAAGLSFSRSAIATGDECHATTNFSVAPPGGQMKSETLVSCTFSGVEYLSATSGTCDKNDIIGTQIKPKGKDGVEITCIDSKALKVKSRTFIGRWELMAPGRH